MEFVIMPGSNGEKEEEKVMENIFAKAVEMVMAGEDIKAQGVDIAEEPLM